MTVSGVYRAASIALAGIEGTAVLVEAAVSSQLPGIVIIGLPDTALAEAKQRVRTAIQQTGLRLTDRMLIINLSPAALPKQGAGFDLAIALSALAASGEIPADKLSRTVHIGELGLDGVLKRPHGLLSAVLAAKTLGFTQVMVPAVCRREAALVSDIEVIAAESLNGAVAWHRNEPSGWVSGTPKTTEMTYPERVGAQHEREEEFEPDMSDVLSQPEAVEAMVIAAAGRHHISLIGPPGSGKTVLAARLVSLLPDLTDFESLEVSSVASLGKDALAALIRRPPFESPHHTASQVSIVGGGSSSGVFPGAVTRANLGVLFLDEAPEFSRAVLDGLRQPLESGEVVISRANLHTILPAKVQLVLAANPCPCGNAYSAEAAVFCRCTPHQRNKYLAKISGPLSDRIDLQMVVRRVSAISSAEIGASEQRSSFLRKRVVAARRKMAKRLQETPWTVNSEVSGKWILASTESFLPGTTDVIDAALKRGSLTLRGYQRTLRVAWTLADLAGKTRPERHEVSQALALRGGYAS